MHAYGIGPYTEKTKRVAQKLVLTLSKFKTKIQNYVSANDEVTQTMQRNTFWRKA